MKTLDRTRDYARIIGSTENNARFEQDDLLFDYHGNCLTTAPATAVAAEALIRAATGPTREELKEQVLALGGKPTHNATIASLTAQIEELTAP